MKYLRVVLGCSNRENVFSDIVFKKNKKNYSIKHTIRIFRNRGQDEVSDLINPSLIPLQLAFCRVKEYATLFLCITSQKITLLISGPPAACGPFSLVTSETSTTHHSSSPRQLPGDWGSLRPCQRCPRQNAGEIPLASGYGAHTAGVTVIYSHPLHEWIHFKRPTQGLQCLFSCTFKGGYITQLNEVFNGSNFTKLFCPTSKTWDTVVCRRSL